MQTSEGWKKRSGGQGMSDKKIKFMTRQKTGLGTGGGRGGEEEGGELSWAFVPGEQGEKVLPRPGGAQGTGWEEMSALVWNKPWAGGETMTAKESSCQSPGTGIPGKVWDGLDPWERDWMDWISGKVWDGLNPWKSVGCIESLDKGLDGLNP